MKKALLLLCLFGALCAKAFPQATSTLSDTFVSPGGAPVQLSLTITPTATFTSADGYPVPIFSKLSVSSSNGAFTVHLVPNAGSTPAGSSYRADYTLNGMQFHETWIVPSSGGTLKLSDVRALSPPVPTVQLSINQITPPSSCASPSNFLQWNLTAWGCAAATGGGGGPTYTFSAPLVNTSGTVSIPAATSSQNGYLALSDWSAFNGKQAALSTFAAPAHQWLTGFTAPNTFTSSRPDYADLTGTPTLATVATTGSYTDLSNKPTIPAAQVNSDWNASSGVAQILNKPTIPAAQVNSDWNASSGVAQILNKPTIPAAQVNSDWNAVSGLAQILNKPSLATVATSGSYNDLSNKPTIPAAQVNSDWNAVSGVAQILNKPTLVTASSGLSDAATLLQTTNTVRHQYTVGTGGVTANGLVKLDTDGTVIAVTGTEGILGIAESTQSAAANVIVDVIGPSTCVAEGAITAGHYLIAGSTSAIRCKDSGQTTLANVATSTRIVGKASAAATDGNTFTLNLVGAYRFGSQVNFTDLQGTATDAQLANGYSGVGACGTHQFASTLSRNAAPTCSQPAFTDISGSVAASQLPNPSASTLGGIESIASSTNNWIDSISTAGVPHLSQPAFSNLSGTASDAQLANAYSGTGSCASHQFETTDNRNAAPTCAQPAFSDISGTATAAQLPAITALAVGVGADGGSTPTAQNAVNIAPFYLQTPVTFSNLSVAVVTGDGSNNSDVGIYDSSGNRKCTWGAGLYSGTGYQSHACTQGSVTLTPGEYVLAITTAASTPAFKVRFSNNPTLGNGSGTSSTTSSGGALPSSISISATGAYNNATFMGALCWLH